MRAIARSLVLAVLLAAPLTGAAASCAAPEGRPSVGLALSGGGARGAAHVGVLQILETLRVPVDCIAGTSMGAIIGGLYASGYSSDELETITHSIDWRDAFRDDPRRRDLSFRRKQDDFDFLADFELGLRDGEVRLPRGLVQGQKLSLLLRALNLPVRTQTDFNRLPIPFRAVATDAADGAPVVLGSGDMAVALRASMAAPGVFSPVERDGRILIDGGISNNLPINVVRAMGADVVIAVDISFPLLPPEDLDSAIALTNQVLTILVRREATRQLATLTPRDVAIVPDLGLLGSSDFTRLDVMIEKGRETARAQTEALTRLALTETDFAAHLSARKNRRGPPAPRLARIVIDDNSLLSAEVIAARMRSRVGEPVDIEVVERDISRIYGMNIFESVDYHIEAADGESAEDAIDLKIRARQKSWGPNFLNFGLKLVDDFEGSSRYNLGARYTRTQVNPLGAEWRVDVQIGDNPKLLTEFYQPVGYASRFFVAPRVLLQKFDADFFGTAGNLLAQYRVTESRYGVDVGYALSDRAELRAGLAYETGRAVLRIGDPALGSFDADGGKLRFQARYDDLDNTAFPGKGGLGGLTWEAIRDVLGADNNRDRLRADWLAVREIGPNRVLASVNLGSNLRGEGRVEDLFELGGLFNLSGYRTGQLRGQHSALGVLSFYRDATFGTGFPMPVYVGATLEAGNVWDDTSDAGFNDLRYGGSAFIGVDTPIGPMYLGYGLAEGGNSAAYFFLGQSFGPRE